MNENNHQTQINKLLVKAFYQGYSGKTKITDNMDLIYASMSLGDHTTKIMYALYLGCMVCRAAYRLREAGMVVGEGADDCEGKALIQIEAPTPSDIHSSEYLQALFFAEILRYVPTFSPDQLFVIPHHRHSCRFVEVGIHLPTSVDLLVPPATTRA